MNPENPPNPAATLPTPASEANGGAQQSAVQPDVRESIAQPEPRMGLAPQPEEESGAVVSEDDDDERHFNGSCKSGARQERLIKITLDTYKASKINSIISKLRMRIEPMENYNMEC